MKPLQGSSDQRTPGQPQMFAVCSKGIVGKFTVSPNGFRFVPWVQRSPSRKDHPTPYSALPRWARDCRIIEAESADNAISIYAQRRGRTL